MKPAASRFTAKGKAKSPAKSTLAASPTAASKRLAVSAPAPTFFASQATFRAWLEANHASATEFYVGFYKKSSGKGGLTYAESVDEALCFGWIDGVMKSLGAESYMHRFTPRKPGSIWSNINVGHVARLTAAGKMHAAGLAAYAARDEKKTGVYAFESKAPVAFSAADAKIFRANLTAWAFFEAQPPGYKRLLTWWVVSAKQDETRARRLEKLIATSAAGKRLQ